MRIGQEIWCLPYAGFFEDLGEKDNSVTELMNELIPKLFVEQPGYTGSVKYLELYTYLLMNSPLWKKKASQKDWAKGKFS